MYRENIYEVMESTGERVNTLVVPKNSGLKGYAWKVLGEAGLDIARATEVGNGKLQLGDITLLLRRGEDIPQIVADEFQRGNVVLGVTGDDLFDEFRLGNPQSSLKVENNYDWFDQTARYFRPALCLMEESGNTEILSGARVASNKKYELTTQNFLQKSPLFEGINPIPTWYSGDIEDRVTSGPNDFCVDIMYSGASMDVNGLTLKEVIRFSDIVVISALDKEESMLGRAVSREFDQLEARMSNPTCSYTSKLLQRPDGPARKLNEEALELVMASLGRGELIGEGADVFYAAMAFLVQQGVSREDLAREMLGRQK